MLARFQSPIARPNTAKAVCSKATRTIPVHALVLLLTSLLMLTGCAQQSPSSPADQARKAFRQGQWSLAVAACDRLLTSDPNNSELISIRARSHGALGEYNRSLEDLNRWVELEPEDPEPLYHRAIAHEKLGHDDLADADNFAAKALDPLYQRAYVYDLPSNRSPAKRHSHRQSEDAVEESIADTIQTEPTNDDRAVVTNTRRARAAAKEDTNDAAREDAIWDRINRRQITEPAHEPSESTGLDVSALVGAADDKPTRKSSHEDALTHIAEQLFQPDADAPPVTQRLDSRANQPFATPMVPQVSSALPTDPYGNVFIPGQQPLGTNPNSGFTRPGAYQGYTPQPGFGPNSLSNPVSTALPPQLYGKLGTNAGVTQYGGAAYPNTGGGMGAVGTGNSRLRVPAVGYGTVPPYGPSSFQLPNSNSLSPPMTPRANGINSPSPRLLLGPAPVSSALPQEYLQQIQQNRSTTPVYPN